MEWFSKNKFWLTGVGLSILSTAVHFLAVNQTIHPTGWDGYYYVMQVHSWLTFGYLQSPDFSLIYPFLTVIAAAAGNAILGYKIGVAIISGLLTATIYFKKQSALVALYVTASPLVTYFILQFPKNALGLILLVLCLQSKNRFLIIVFFLATLLTHRMTGAFAIIAAVIYSLRHVSWKWIALGVVCLIALTFLPGVIHLSDLQRFDDQFTIVPHWAPLSFSFIFPRSLSLLFKIDLILVSVLIISSLVLFYKHKQHWLWLPVALISIFPFFQFKAGDVGYRFFLVAPVAFIMLMPAIEWKPRVQWALAGMFFIAALFSWKSYKPPYFDPPNNRYAYIIGNLSDRYSHHDYPLVIAHKSLAEMIIFKTDFDALNWLPPEDMPQQHVLRLINGVNYTDIRKHLDEVDRSLLRSIASGYFALPEDAWQRLVASVKNSNDEKVMKRIMRGGNPMDKRPYYLNKGKNR
ncbi:MAG TPA: hypothetical protein VFE50_18595 [Cyclobacteriaceae bacterium]|nr:hypothetical protein [Cyclobacteriaceae bacterium]